MQSVFLFAIALLAGYYLSVYASKPIEKNGKKRPNRLPALRFRNIEFLPNVKIHYRNHTLHVHHWIFLSVVMFVAIFLYDNIMHFATGKAAAGASVGGIIHGLRYPDRFRLRHPRVKK